MRDLAPADGSLTIVNRDTRSITAATVWLDGTDSLSGQHYSDWEAFSNILYGYGVSYGYVQTMFWDINWYEKPDILYGSAYYWSQGLNYSEINIVDRSANTRFNSMIVTVQATIDGACHQDWEQVNLLDSPTIYFDGRNATWNGSCWVGDLLHH